MQYPRILIFGYAFEIIQDLNVYAVLLDSTVFQIINSLNQFLMLEKYFTL